MKGLIKENHAVKSKYVAVFYYIDQALIVLSATSGGVSIISFTSIIGAPVGIASACLTLIVILKIIKYNKKKKRKNMIKFLCWLKVNSIALKL